MHDFAFGTCPFAAVAWRRNSVGSVSPARNPDDPIRSAWRRLTPGHPRAAG